MAPYRSSPGLISMDAEQTKPQLRPQEASIKSRFQAEIPLCSVQKWVFSSLSTEDLHRKAWIDSDSPGTHFLTFAEACLLAKRIALGLLKQGLRPGDRVLLFAGNSIFYPPMVLGIWMACGVFTGASPGFSAHELAFQLQDSQATFMIAGRYHLDTALSAAKVVGMNQDQVFIMDADPLDVTSKAYKEHGGLHHWTDLLASRDEGQAFIWDEPADPRTTTCTLNYSSGTTGLPKGVEITHYNIVANGVGVVALNQLHPEYEARNRNAAALCFLPMYHAFSQGYFITSLPYERIPIYIMQKFDLVKMLSHVQNFHITKLMAVPPVLVLMTKHPLAQQADLSSLDMLGSGAAPLAVDTQKEINRLLNREDTKLRQGWGMTEVTCTAIAWDPNRPSSPGVGELMPNCKARLVDPTTGQDITEAMVPGELWISGPNVMRGYWHNPSATREAFVLDEGGTEWLRTGDVAYVEEYATGTLFHIVDRFKELIKVNGHQVAPAELEALLVERNDVIDAAVVGAVVGTEELPRAYIVRRPGATTSEDEISSWLAERVVRYKWLSGGVVFTNAIPKNPSGKILRKILRERAKQELATRPRI